MAGMAVYGIAVVMRKNMEIKFPFLIKYYSATMLAKLYAVQREPSIRYGQLEQKNKNCGE